MPFVKKAKSKIERYGALWEPGTEEASIELQCIARGGRWQFDNGAWAGAGTATHIINFAKLTWPWFQWHRWATDLILPELCKPSKKSRVGIFGPSSSGKSCICGMTALTFYFALPNQTAVIVTSTTRDDLESRIWGEIKMFYAQAKEKFPWLPGHMIESKQLITTDGKDIGDGRDLRKGVMGKPVKKGGSWVGLESLVGIKSANVIAVADEVHLMNDGFNDSLANLESNPCFRGWELGNLNDLSSQLGLACEPAMGWDSLPDSNKSRVYMTRFKNGTAIQLLGHDSPNLDFPEGAEPYPKLIGRDYLERMAHNYGVDTPLYNMFASGKIPRSTMANKVITKQDCVQFCAFEEVNWGHKPLTKIYGADISYTADHGDRTVGLPLAFGEDSEGKIRLALLEKPLVFTPSDRASGSIEEQIAYQAKAECIRLGIPPEHFFFDGTGRSSFTAAAMRIWSTSVVPIEFGGKASDRPNFLNRRYDEDKGPDKKKGDLLPCSEVFGKMVTELWFAVAHCIRSDQMRNLTEEVSKEGYMRIWFLVGGNKIDVEPKDDLKLRLRRSPDIFEALVSGVEGARRLGFPLGNVDKRTKQRNHGWLGKIRKEFEEAGRSAELSLPS